MKKYNYLNDLYFDWSSKTEQKEKRTLFGNYIFSTEHLFNKLKLGSLESLI
jgi:hypothetical protein